MSSLATTESFLATRRGPPCHGPRGTADSGSLRAKQFLSHKRLMIVSTRLGAVFVAFLFMVACGDENAGSPHRASSKRDPTRSTEDPTPGKPGHPTARPVPLRRLPQQGFVVGFRRQVRFVDLEGELIYKLEGYELEGNPGAKQIGLKGLRPRVHFRLDIDLRKLVPISSESAETFYDEGPSPRLPIPPGSREKDIGVVGLWRYAIGSPTGVVLGQWSGECEIPTAFWIERGRRPRIITGEPKLRRAQDSISLGWSKGDALVLLPGDGCGDSGDPPGIYVFSAPGNGELIYPTPEGARADMWSLQDN